MRRGFFYAFTVLMEFPCCKQFEFPQRVMRIKHVFLKE